MKLVIGGQLAQKEIETLVRKLAGDRIGISVKSDMAAAMDLRNGTADYYLGSCATGGGGSLAMAIALNGYDKCLTVAMPGKTLDDSEITAAIDRGVKAFGFVPQAMDAVVPVIVNHLLQ